MPISAVPSYLGQDFKDASPGLQFGMYLKFWGVNRRTQEVLWTKTDITHQVRGQDPREREVPVDNKAGALEAAAILSRSSIQTANALIARQQADAVSANAFTIPALATAPFTTGLGIEHPLENGFAFLNPYGLPYLPGSGIKGVLRRAAQELADGLWGEGDHGWSHAPICRIKVDEEHVPLSAIDVLFGREPEQGDGNAVRGVLSFWDAIPEIAGSKLLVDVMTPHQSHYYQQKSDRKSGDSVTPHDSGQPTPIPFLTIPPGSKFAFHVTCDRVRLHRLAPAIAEEACWQALLRSAFEHAFEWLGFGAKTAVGYGAMSVDTRAIEEREHKLAEDAKLARAATLTQAQRDIEAFVDYMRGRHESLRGKPTRANGAEHNRVREFVKLARGSAEWSSDDRVAAAEAVEEWMPKVVDIKFRDEAKKLQLAELREPE